jgi:hypothetical protein
LREREIRQYVVALSDDQKPFTREKIVAVLARHGVKCEQILGFAADGTYLVNLAFGEVGTLGFLRPGQSSGFYRKWYDKKVPEVKAFGPNQTPVGATEVKVVKNQRWRRGH